MKNLLLSSLLITTCTLGHAKDTKNPILSNIRFSGYGIEQYQYVDQKNAKSNTFNTRLLRLALDGRIQKDFYWKVQLQLNGNNSNLNISPRVVDVFAEWQKLPFLKIKVGQFKRPFTYENPLHPIDQGFMSFAQSILKFAGFSDRHMGHASNGRDIGLQIQGDFMPNSKGRNLFHYQIGIFNGQGINVKDVDQRKDIIGGIWVMPIEGLRLGIFGWEGSYAQKGTWRNSDGKEHKGIKSLPQHRYAISGEYKANDWTFRSEYIHSTGEAFAKTYENQSTSNKLNISSKGSKGDGYYALIVAPAIKKKLYLKARYDLYRDNGLWNSAKTRYEIGANYIFNKRFQINTEYAFVNDRALEDPNYNLVDVQISFRF